MRKYASHHSTSHVTSMIMSMYPTHCTGIALETVEAHTGAQDITLYGSCFCPFVQRVWVALEYLQIPYKVSVLADARKKILRNGR